MKSIYLRNFVATAIMVSVCFLIVAFSFVGIGRNYLISEYREDMVNSAREVSRTAAAIAPSDSLNSWVLSMTLSSVSNSTGNQVFIADPNGVVVTCSDRRPVCEHMGYQMSPEILHQLSTNGSINQITNLGGLYESNRYVVAQPIIVADTGEILGYVFVTNVIDNMLGAWSTFLGVTAVVTAAVFIAALVISLIYSKRIESFNKMADSLEMAEARRTEFIANISHELRTPMTTISGFADGILDGTIPKEDEEKYLRSIRDETRRLSRLVRDMLDVSQMRARAADPSKRTVFDLTELVLQTLLSFESRATKKGLDVDPQLPDNHIMVRADKDAITQVIYNLLDNAVKFAHEGTCITLRLYKDNGKAYVSVKDVGETIPPDDLPFIFDRFHKSDRSRSLDTTGVGLGLYLVKSIINSHDEDIAVRSEDGVTEFVFTLALA